MPIGAFPGAGGGYPGAVARVDSIMTVGQTLLSYVNLSLQNGDLVYVGNETFSGHGSIRAYVRVRIGAGLTPTEGEVWNSTAMTSPQVQYERLGEASAHYLEQVAWIVTNDDTLGAAIIDNDGTVGESNFPVSMREVNRRRAGDTQGIGTAIVIQLPNMTAPARSELLACTLSNWWATDGNGDVTMLGLTAAPAYSGVISAYATRAGNTGYLLSATGLGTALAGIDLPVLITRVDLGKSALVVEVLGANQVRIGQPRAGADALGFTVGTATNFVVGETVILPAAASSTLLPALPIWPFIPGQIPFTSAGFIDFSGFDAESNTMAFGSDSPFLINCLINGLEIKGGNISANLAVVGMRGFVNLDVGSLSIWSCAFGGAPGGAVGRVNVLDATTSFGDLDVTNCSVLVRHGDLVIDSGGTLSTNNVPGAQAACVRADEGGNVFAPVSDWWGSGNGCPLGTLQPGSMFGVSKGLVTVLTSNLVADFVVLDGVVTNYPRATISINNPLGGGVVDAAAPTWTGTINLTVVLVTANGSTTTSFAANPGTLLLLATANQTLGQRFPTSQRWIKRMRINKRIAGGSVPAVFTLVKNGVATTQTLTAAAADPVGTKYVDSAHPIFFADGDDFDVQVTGVSDATPGTSAYSITLEG